MCALPLITPPLRLRIGYDMMLELARPTPMLLLLYVHPDRAADLQSPERINTDPIVPIEDFTDPFGNRLARVIAPEGRFRIWSESVIGDSGQPDAHDPTAQQHAIEHLPATALPFLLGSRYCEVDRLNSVAWDLFGKLPLGFPRVQAINDWVFNNIKFGYRFARHNKTALDTYTERTGVCRDMMHLAIAFCRALNIPARYATGYLGDINAAPDPTPMDFSAFYEVYLSGQWWPMDARHNVPRIGRVLMARGRDAVDCALTTTFGAHRLVSFKVFTDELSNSGELRRAG